MARDSRGVDMAPANRPTRGRPKETEESFMMMMDEIVLHD